MNQQVPGSAIERQQRFRPLAAALLLGACTNAEQVSFHQDVKPLFDARCVVCHSSDQPNLVDLEDPFNATPRVGSNHRTVGGVSMPFERNDYGPPFTVAPYEPENSYLLEKVTNRALRPEACTPDRCLPDEAGFFMPPGPKPLIDGQIELVRDWIRSGAAPAAFENDLKQTLTSARSLSGPYTLLNLFGDFSNLRSGPPDEPCAYTGSDRGCNQCSACHREGGPYNPQGVRAEDFINVPATFRSDLKLVVPGKPEESFLMMKLEARVPSSEIGSPMPYGYQAFSEDNVATLRQWIAEGARDN